MSLTKYDPQPVKKPINYPAPTTGKYVPLIDPAILLPHKKQLLWAGIKRDNPSLAEMLKNDETIALLKKTFDAKIMFTEAEAIGYMTEVHDA